jgi:hypothetical protein
MAALRILEDALGRFSFSFLTLVVKVLTIYYSSFGFGGESLKA